jgi:hypothetical protein
MLLHVRTVEMRLHCRQYDVHAASSRNRAGVSSAAGGSARDVTDEPAPSALDVHRVRVAAHRRQRNVNAVGGTNERSRAHVTRALRNATQRLAGSSLSASVHKLPCLVHASENGSHRTVPCSHA